MLKTQWQVNIVSPHGFHSNEREEGDDIQQKATCRIGSLSLCGEDTASVHGRPFSQLRLTTLTPKYYQSW